ncbi:hypothetical protein OG21DRAFT_544007 [Imleria badia]|nr:hypothetical protein OG21DRAFT_544007 [Imleria badia]
MLIPPLRACSEPSTPKNDHFPEKDYALATVSPSSFSSASSTIKPLLKGSILSANLAFEKHVAIRFTLDYWQTASKVGAHYFDSFPPLPSHILPSPFPPTPADSSPHMGRGWDRFTFTIRLEDYAHSLSPRTLFLAPLSHHFDIPRAWLLPVQFWVNINGETTMTAGIIILGSDPPSQLQHLPETEPAGKLSLHRFLHPAPNLNPQ